MEIEKITSQDKILVTGAAGFIGFSLIRALLKKGAIVTGLDCINDYYTPQLKYDRLTELGIKEADIKDKVRIQSRKYPNFHFIHLDLTDKEHIDKLFADGHFDYVVNLAGQAGVRYSIENPYSYINSNVLGFLNILEGCRHHPVKHLVYASSSSVYGITQNAPSKETDDTDHPVSLYAATKKSNELMAYAYSKLYNIPATGVRFFTVYGPWGRPDMAPTLFMKSIIEEKPINVFNHGKLQRDFTYIDDIISGVLCLLQHPSTDDVPHRVYNIGHSTPITLESFISSIEHVTGKKAIQHMKDMQPGDVFCTCADATKLEKDFGFHPSISLEEGMQQFYDWFIHYYRS